ncbi:MAG: AMP-binding protein [Ilumatobacteraceae bacterium]
MQAQGMGLAWWAKRDPHRAAIVSPKGDRTFAELNARANQLARALRARGVSGGDSVALMCGNRPEFAETINACLRIGVRMTPINWHLTADETAYILEDCEAVALVADADLGDVPRAAAERVPGVRVRLAVGGPIDGFEDYEAALGDHPARTSPIRRSGRRCLHLRDHRAPEGRAPLDRRRSPGVEHLRLRRGLRDRSSSLHWTALSRCTARVLAVDPASPTAPRSCSWNGGARRRRSG